jgi:hypothetical protein
MSPGKYRYPPMPTRSPGSTSAADPDPDLSGGILGTPDAASPPSSSGGGRSPGSSPADGACQRPPRMSAITARIRAPMPAGARSDSRNHVCFAMVGSHHTTLPWHPRVQVAFVSQRAGCHLAPAARRAPVKEGIARRVWLGTRACCFSADATTGWERPPAIPRRSANQRPRIRVPAWRERCLSGTCSSRRPGRAFPTTKRASPQASARPRIERSLGVRGAIG